MMRVVVAFLVVGGAAVGGIVLLARHNKPRRGKKKHKTQRLADVVGAKESLQTMPHGWWLKRAPRSDRLCYDTKTDAMNKFREWNQAVIDNWGGETAAGSKGEFDAMTKHGARPKNVVEALWVALPPERTRYGKGPFCLTDIDIEALNETSPGKDHVTGFTLPEYVSEALIDKRYEEYYRSQVAGRRRAA
jgi:hypothetical protein